MSEGSDSDTEQVLHDREAGRPSQLTTNTASPAVGPTSSLLLRGDPATARACETAARCSTIINMLLDANDDHQSSADAPTRAHIAPAAAVASTVTSLSGTVAALTAKLELTRAKYQAAKTQLRYTSRATWLTASHTSPPTGRFRRRTRRSRHHTPRRMPATARACALSQPFSPHCTMSSRRTASSLAPGRSTRSDLTHSMLQRCRNDVRKQLFADGRRLIRALSLGGQAIAEDMATGRV